MLQSCSLSGNHEKASVGKVMQAERDMSTPKMSPLVLRDVEVQVPGPEGLPSGESCKICRDLTIAFQRLLLKHPAVHWSGMAVLRQEEGRGKREEANFGLLLDFVACAAKTRQVVIREVEGGTGVVPIAGEVETTGGGEWVIQAALQDGGPWTELAREEADAGGADEALLRDLRVLLDETLAGWGGMDSGPPVRAVACAVETRTVSIREVEVGAAVGGVPRSVKTEEVVTRMLDVHAVLEEGSPE